VGVVAAAVDQVTGRWADALFGLARRKGVLDQVSADIERIALECQSPVVVAFLQGATGETSERLAKFDDLLKNAHAHTRSFVGLLFERRREEVLLQIGVAFEQRLLEERGAAKGVVESARPLDPAELEALSKDLSRRLGKDVTLTGRVDPTLVGGVRVFVGARMIDQSLQGRMDGLRRRMMGARLPAVGP
jgi:F-type H+-transporting ATPase subunit delta